MNTELLQVRTDREDSIRHRSVSTLLPLADHQSSSEGCMAQHVCHRCSLRYHHRTVGLAAELLLTVFDPLAVFRIEAPTDNTFDPLSTLLFVLTQTLIDIRQSLAVNQHHVQLSNDEIIHRKCFLNTLRQLPLCWLTILHKVLVKRLNVNIIVINFHQFLCTIVIPTSSCSLKLFDMVVWKMMDEIMTICYQNIFVGVPLVAFSRETYDFPSI